MGPATDEAKVFAALSIATPCRVDAQRRLNKGLEIRAANMSNPALPYSILAVARSGLQMLSRCAHHDLNLHAHQLTLIYRVTQHGLLIDATSHTVLHTVLQQHPTTTNCSTRRNRSFKRRCGARSLGLKCGVQFHCRPAAVFVSLPIFGSKVSFYFIIVIWPDLGAGALPAERCARVHRLNCWVQHPSTQQSSLLGRESAYPAIVVAG